MKSFNHPNVMNLLGVTFKPRCLVFELMGACLQDFLRSVEEDPLPAPVCSFNPPVKSR